MSDEKEVSTSSVEETVEDQAPKETEGQVEKPTLDGLANEVQGLKQGIQAERTKRQEAEERARLLEQMAYQQQETQVEPRDDYDPEDIPTNETVKKMIQKELGTQTDRQRQMSLAKMEADARNKHEDYDKMVGVGSYFDQIQRNQPGLLELVETSPNPYQMAYELGKTHPEYQESLIKKATEEAAEKIQKNLNKTSTLSGVGGEVDDDTKKFQGMSDQDFEKEVHRVKGY